MRTFSISASHPDVQEPKEQKAAQSLCERALGEDRRRRMADTREETQFYW